MYPTSVPSTKCLTRLMHQISANAPRPAPTPIRIPMKSPFPKIGGPFADFRDLS